MQYPVPPLFHPHVGANQRDELASEVITFAGVLSATAALIGGEASAGTTTRDVVVVYLQA